MKPAVLPSRPIVLWLLAGCALIAAMVVVGGITRLTGSGLSITEWNVLMGAIPPLTEADWAELFRKYQATPQYQLVNAAFSVSDFKTIFWWEYIHRLIGRALGLVFVVPFVFFLARGWLDRPLRNRLLVIFALGAFQGFLGWFMVASGLSGRTSVSHYRLAAHLLTALLTLAVTWWTALVVMGRGRPAVPVPTAIRAQVRLFLGLTALQITYGAFTAGLKAGFAYNTFPRMGDRVVPAGLLALSPAWRNVVENPVMVQFLHRSLAWLLVILGCWLWYTLRVHGFRRPANLLLAGLGIQFTLGILTILRLHDAPVVWGTLHQLGAVVLLVTAVYVLFTVRRPLQSPGSDPAVTAMAA